MHRSNLLPILGLTLSTTQITHCQTHKNTSLLTWGPCSDIRGSRITTNTSCANLTVPLDYTAKESTKTLNLQILRVAAKKTPALGSIILNFGGPGVDGRTQLVQVGDYLQEITGGQHHLVTFDPRGTGNTLPINCYQDDRQLLTNNVLTRETANASDTSFGRLWGMGKVVADSCHANLGQTGELVGTAFVARDAMQIVDALGEDGLLKYWGFSYGSTLGVTIASMFPDRIDRMILDGIVNVHEYFHDWDTSRFSDTDETFSSFISACAATNSGCALARNGVNAAQLANEVFSFLENDLKYNPIPNGGSLIEYSAVKAFMLGDLSSPLSWTRTANVIHSLLTRNESSLRVYAQQMGNYSRSTTSDAQTAIRCGDKPKDLRIATREKAEPIMKRMYQISKVAGDTFVPTLMRCVQWKMPAKEHPVAAALSGSIKMRHPMLLIGNTLDPVTPIRNAFNISKSFEGSAVLRQDGYGHTSMAQPSVCTARAIQEYFVNGTLPAAGAVCKPDLFPFSAGRSQGASRRWVDEDDDTQLLRALQTLEKLMRGVRGF